MGKALYRGYRPTSFDEVIGQDHITTTLKNSLRNGTVSHAYLLTGPRGVGKTSIARVLAYAVNDLAYEKDGIHLDIIEIDAASNRRIDEIRDLRERVHIAPTSAKYKVYIIDEVHMLTREAFNALLKTLEEPPAHVIFILATTELHKLPETIVSRCITFQFRPIDDESLVKHLQHIAKSEKLKISEDALRLIAQHGGGSFRDSISLLDQIKNIKSGLIERQDIELSLGLAPTEIIDKILNSVASGEPAQLNSSLQAAYRQGASETNLARQIGERIRHDLIANNSHFSPLTATKLLKELLDVPGSPKPRTSLELQLLTALFESSPNEPAPQITPKTIQPEEKPKPVPEVKPEVAVVMEDKTEKKATTKVHIDETMWNEILEKLKKQNNTLYGIARMAKAELQDKTLLLSFKFPFHFKQISQPKNKSILAAIIEELGHKDVQLNINLLTKDEAKEITKPASGKKDDRALTNITDIFGAGEVLES